MTDTIILYASDDPFLKFKHMELQPIWVDLKETKNTDGWVWCYQLKNLYHKLSYCTGIKANNISCIPKNDLHHVIRIRSSYQKNHSAGCVL